jgi:flagellar biosynthesis anti-sigma factor FlgM
MKIGPSQPDNLRAEAKSTQAERATGVRPGADANTPAGAGSVDRISLSGAAPALAAGGVPFDEKKVEEVRRAIQEGRFPVDARKVADQLLADARDLLGTGQGAAKP